MSYRGKVFLINGLWMFLLTQSIVVPFFSQYKLGMTEIFIIQAVHSLVLLIFDVPSSYFADKFGRKKILLLAGFVRGVGGILFYCSTSFPTFLMTYIVIGFGNSLFSGAGLSVLYDDESPGRINNPLLKNYNVTKFFSIAAFFIGSLLATFSLNLPAFVNMITAWLPFVFIMTLKKPKFMAKVDRVSLAGLLKFFKTKNIQFLALCLFSSIYSSIAVINLYFSQAVFMSFSKSLYIYGILICASQILMMAFSRNIQLGESRQSKVMLIIWFSTPFIYLLFSFHNIAIFFGAIFGSECVRWMNQVHLLNWINRNISEEYRSTMNSLINFLSVMVIVFIAPFVGYFVSTHGVALAAYFLSLLFFVLPVVSYLIYKVGICYARG